MARYCRHCGVPVDPADRFCMQCGKPLYRQPSAPAGPQPAPALRMPAVRVPALSRRAAGLLGGALALCFAAAGGAWYWLQPPAATEAHFMPLIASHVQQHQAAFTARYCLDNLPYDRDPVLTHAMDGQTNRWMAQLVDAGLYAQPEKLGNGFFILQYRYAKTPLGVSATRSGKLCLADGVQLDGIADISPPRTVNGLTGAVVTYRYTLKGVKPWAGAGLRAQLPDSGGKAQARVLLVVHDRQWVEASDAEAARFAGEDARTPDTPPARGGDWLAWLRQWLPGQGPDESDVRQALGQVNLLLGLDLDQVKLQSCEAQTENRYLCQIEYKGKPDRLRLDRQEDGSWRLH